MSTIKKVVVFGGSGFIGSHVVARLLKDNYVVTVADRITNISRLTSDLLEVEGKRNLVHTCLVDIKDRGQVSDLMFQHDAGINLAGILGTSETVNDPYPSVETNILGGLNFIEACRQHGRAGVQIAVGNHFMNNSYAITKSTTERFALMYNKEHKTDIAVVRGLNAYGPGQHHKPVRKIIPNFVTSALRGEPIKVYGDGEQIMDMIWVKDLADVLVRALTSDAPKNQTFDAGTGIPTTVNDIANLVNEISGNKAGIEHIEMRAGEPKDAKVLANVINLKDLGYRVASIPYGSSERGSALTVLDFKRLKDGLEETINWYRDNYDWRED